MCYFKGTSKVQISHNINLTLLLQIVKLHTCYWLFCCVQRCCSSRPDVDKLFQSAFGKTSNTLVIQFSTLHLPLEHQCVCLGIITTSYKHWWTELWYTGQSVFNKNATFDFRNDRIMFFVIYSTRDDMKTDWQHCWHFVHTSLHKICASITQTLFHR